MIRQSLSNNNTNDNNNDNVHHRVPMATMHHQVTASTEVSILPPKVEVVHRHVVHKDTAIPLSTRMVLSAVAGMGAASLCHPLDVIRVHMQVYPQHYRHSWHATKSIFQNAGVSNGLYAGLSAAYLRQWIYGSCRMGVYSHLLEQAKMTNQARGRSPNDISFATKLSMGGICGAMGVLAGTPCGLALVRMGADSGQPLELRRNYTSVVNCFARIAREEGITKLWRGVVPAVSRATLLSGCQMGITSEVKVYLCTHQQEWFGPNGQWLDGYPVLLCATLVSSFCACVAANPFDVVKSRMQSMIIAADGTAMYKGMTDCFVKSIRAEGPSVLMAGFTPAFIKLAPYTIISLTLAEKLTKAVTGKDAL